MKRSMVSILFIVSRLCTQEPAAPSNLPSNIYLKSGNTVVAIPFEVAMEESPFLHDLYTDIKPFENAPSKASPGLKAGASLFRNFTDF